MIKKLTFVAQNACCQGVEKSAFSEKPVTLSANRQSPLECAVEETDDRGRKKRTTEAKDSGRGIPQGSRISPLLANLYMRRFVLERKRRGWRNVSLAYRDLGG